MDWKLELIAIPVSDVDRAKAFYTEKAGFHADHDHTVSAEIRFVQLTPPGSACSIAIGKGIVEGEPGSVRGLQMVVADIEAAHADLVARRDARFSREQGEPDSLLQRRREGSAGDRSDVLSAAREHIHVRARNSTLECLDPP